MPEAACDLSPAAVAPVTGRDTAPSDGKPESVAILGVPVSIVDMSKAVDTILGWVKSRREHYVCVRDVHGLMLSVRDPEMLRIQCAAGMVTPDGMPLVWVGKLRTKRDFGRVCGSDLMDALCAAGQSLGLRHYFYGGKPGVPERLIANLRAKYPDLAIAGHRSPPFRTLTAEEDAAEVDAIIGSGAEVVWVGLGTPKQEYWMRDHVGRIRGATLIGVGAAFDFQSGALTRAPRWMQKSGLEWAHRLASEPRRLWHRYIVVSSMFLVAVAAEQLAIVFGRKPADGARAAPAPRDFTETSP